MKTFFKKLFKRGDFMTRADKWYYKKVIKTWLWSAFAFVIIAWVGTNLVLCALTTNVKSGGDIIFAPVKDVVLPIGQELNKAIKNTTNYDTANSVIKTITFDKYKDDGSYKVGTVDLATQEAEAINVDGNVYLYRLNGGADVYILCKGTMFANPDSSYSFNYLQAATKFTFNNFDISKVTNMGRMFRYCSALNDLSPISNWDVSHVTDMNRMFSTSGISSLQAISNWDVRELRNIYQMFYGCSNLTNVDYIKNWKNPQKIENLAALFSDCNSLQTVDLSGWKLEPVSISQLFGMCEKLTSVNLRDWNVSQVTFFYTLFYNCPMLRTVDLSGWDTRNATTMGHIFDGDSNLRTIYASTSFVTTKADVNSFMFCNCTSLMGEKGTTYDASRYAMDYPGGFGYDLDYARIDGGPNSSTPGYFTAK